MEQDKVKEICKEIVRLLEEQTRVMKAGRSGSFGDMTVEELEAHNRRTERLRQLCKQLAGLT